MLKEKFNALKNMLSLNLESDASIETLMNKLSNSPNIEIDYTASQNGKLIFHFRDENKAYTFKYDSYYPPENEIFFSQIAKFLGIDVISNEIVELGSLKGILQERPREPQTHYVNVEDLLQTVPFEEREGNYFKSVEKALSIHYQNRQDCAQLVEDLMGKIIETRILYTVLGINEFPSVHLQEFPDGKVNLAPLEPKESLFGGLLRRKPLSIDEQQETLKRIILEMDKIINDLSRYQARDNITKLIESLWVLKRNNIEELFKLLGRDAIHEIKRILQIKYISMCKNQLDLLINALGIEKLPVSKDVDLDYILSMTNSRQYNDGEIAATLITPIDTHHVAAIEGATAHHEELFVDVYNRIYGEEPTNIRLSIIEIHHISRDSANRQAIVHVPYYITPYEYSQLSEVLIKLNNRDVEIVADQRVFNPINGSFMQSTDKEFAGLEILDYLKSNGFVADYPWQFKKTNINADETKTF